MRAVRGQTGLNYSALSDVIYSWRCGFKCSALAAVLRADEHSAAAACFCATSRMRSYEDITAFQRRRAGLHWLHA